MAPPTVVNWANRAYPRPKIDPDWLDACYSWVLEEVHLNPDTQMNEIIFHINIQLLESDLHNSMLQGTGFPTDISVSTVNKVKLRGPPILVEVTAVTEIGTSAFQLQNIRQTRLDREDLAGLVGENAAQEDEGPIPKFPRGMLRLEITDGTITIPAIEYRRLPELDLITTPLGYKMILGEVMIRRGIAFLEPKVVTMKGHQTAERDQNRDLHFVWDLNRRLGKPGPPTQESTVSTLAPSLPISSSRSTAIVRCPLQERLAPPEPADVRLDMDYDDDEDLPRKRRVPMQNTTPVSSLPLSAAPTLVESQYFDPSASSTVRSLATTAPSSTVQPRRFPRPSTEDHPILIDSSMETDSLPSTSNNITHSRNLKAPTGPLQPGAAPASDFDFDDSLDATFFDELDQVEKTAIEKASSSDLGVASGTSRIFSSEPQRIITIDSDDEDDKENVPVPTRRVRRRVGMRPTQTINDEVIDLSD